MPTPHSLVRSALLAAVMLFAGGCVYEPVASPDRRSDAFDENGNAVFRIGTSSREAIFAKFDRPSYATQHDLACGYLFSVKTGRAKGVLMGPCMPYFGTADIIDLDDVWLEFDEHGILKRVEKHLVAKAKNNMERAWLDFVAPVPDKIRSEQMVGGHP